MKQNGFKFFVLLLRETIQVQPTTLTKWSGSESNLYVLIIS